MPNLDSNIRATLIVFFYLFSTGSVADNYIICKTPTTKYVGKGGCINVYNPTDDKVCTGKDEKICSTESLEALCYLTGKALDIPFDAFASGVGIIKSEAACLQECNNAFGGKYEKFGGECFGVVSKRSNASPKSKSTNSGLGSKQSSIDKDRQFCAELGYFVRSCTKFYCETKVFSNREMSLK